MNAYQEARMAPAAAALDALYMAERVLGYMIAQCERFYAPREFAEPRQTLARVRDAIAMAVPDHGSEDERDQT